MFFVGAKVCSWVGDLVYNFDATEVQVWTTDAKSCMK